MDVLVGQAMVWPVHLGVLSAPYPGVVESRPTSKARTGYRVDAHQDHRADGHNPLQSKYVGQASHSKGPLQLMMAPGVYLEKRFGDPISKTSPP